jgi:CxxC-x17-CxxC domain-containing protein
MTFVDKTLNCRECGNEFVWTAGEQQFYSEKGLVNTPSRCADCRRQRRQSSNASMSQRSSRERAPRIQFPVTCANCGKETTVPFEPKHERPVYCSDCFDQMRAPAR